MNPLPKKAYDEFRQHWKAEYGEELSEEATKEMADDLIRMMTLITKPSGAE